MILRGIAHKRYCLLVVCPKAARDKQFSLADICGGEECMASHRRFSAQNCHPWKSFLTLPLLYPHPETRHMPFYCWCSSSCETVRNKDLKRRSSPLVALLKKLCKLYTNVWKNKTYQMISVLLGDDIWPWNIFLPPSSIILITFPSKHSLIFQRYKKDIPVFLLIGYFNLLIAMEMPQSKVLFFSCTGEQGY